MLFSFILGKLLKRFKESCLFLFLDPCWYRSRILTVCISNPTAITDKPLPETHYSHARVEGRECIVSGTMKRPNSHQQFFAPESSAWPVGSSLTRAASPLSMTGFPARRRSGRASGPTESRPSSSTTGSSGEQWPAEVNTL